MAAPSRATHIAVIAALIVLTLAVLAGGGYYLWTLTPQYAVQQLLAAQAAGDVEAFEQYADLDLISEQVAVLGDTRLDQALEGLIGSAGQWAGGIRAMAEGKRDKIRDALKGYVKDGIRERVGAKSFSWHTLAVLQRGKIAELADYIKTGSPAEFLGQGPVTSTKQTALAILHYRTPEGETEDVTLQLQKNPSGWQVVAVKQLP